MDENETVQFLMSVRTPIDILPKFTKIDGQALVELDKSDLQAMNIGSGWYLSFIRNRQSYLEGSQPNSINKIYLPDSATPTIVKEVTSKLSVTFLIHSVYNIDERDYSYEVQFSIIFVWSDLDMWAACSQMTDGGQPEKDSCKYAWRPVPRFHNSRDIEIEAITLLTDPSIKLGFIEYRIRGQFRANMDFVLFPHDKQVLPIAMSLEQVEGSPYTRQEVIFYPVLADFGSSLKVQYFQKGESLSGWTLTSVTAREAPFRFEDDDLAVWSANSPAQDIISVMAADLSMDENTLRMNAKEAIGRKIISRVYCEINISRNTTFYIMNYIVTIAIFTMLSLCSFFIAQDGIHDRCGVSLTVILAINVYQLILNDNMPATGYLTRMVIFIFVSTTFVSFTIIEAIFVYISVVALEKEEKRSAEENKANNIQQVLHSHGRNNGSNRLAATNAQEKKELIGVVVDKIESTKQKIGENVENKESNHTIMENIEDAIEEAMEDASEAFHCLSMRYHHFVVTWLDFLSILFFMMCA